MALLFVVPVLASTYEYYISLSVLEISGTVRDDISILVDLSNDDLVSLGYLDSDGLETEMQLGFATGPYSVIGSKLGLTVESIVGYQRKEYRYYTGYDPANTSFDIITGYEGLITIADANPLELGNDFEIEWDSVWLDTDAGDGKDLLYKENAFITYVSGATDISVVIAVPDLVWTERAPQLVETTIYSLAVYNGKLYGGTSPLGNLFEWNDVDAWVQVAPQLNAQGIIYDLIVYDDGGGDDLYGCTDPGGRLFQWNDVDAWVEVAPALLGQTQIYALEVYDDGGGDALYGSTGGGGMLFQWNDVNLWVQVAPQLGIETDIRSLAVYDSGTGESLYGGTAPNGELYEWNDVNLWVSAAPQLNAQTNIYDLAVYDSGVGDHLYGCTGAGGRLFEWDDTSIWVQVAPQQGAATSLWSMTTYETPFGDGLYVTGGAAGTLLRWNNVDTLDVMVPLLTEANQYGLIEYNDILYAGTGVLGRLYEWEYDLLTATATGVASGEHDITVGIVER